MEKTLEFTIKEALESGRRSAMPAFLEMELREKIALEIEEQIESINASDEPNLFISGLQGAVAIVRGKK